MPIILQNMNDDCIWLLRKINVGQYLKILFKLNVYIARISYALCSSLCVLAAALQRGS